jgi:hypothetical protein
LAHPHEHIIDPGEWLSAMSLVENFNGHPQPQILGQPAEVPVRLSSAKHMLRDSVCTARWWFDASGCHLS